MLPPPTADTSAMPLPPPRIMIEAERIAERSDRVNVAPPFTGEHRRNSNLFKTFMERKKFVL